MLFRTVHAELIKYKHSPIWVAFLVLPIFPAFLGTFNYLGNLEILKNGWYDLWSQHTLFSSTFFMPAQFGVFCSYQWRLEHTNRNWNSVMVSPVPVADLYFAKLILCVGISVLAQVCIAIFYLLCGKLAGIGAEVPPQTVEWLLCGVVGGIAVCSIQLLLSMVIRSFVIPVGIALLGGISGLIFTSRGWGFLSPYSLLCVGMRANHPTLSIEIPLFLLSAIVFLVAFSAISILLMKKRDVVTG